MHDTTQKEFNMALPVIPKKHFDVKSKFLPKGKITLSPFTTGLETILLEVKDGSTEKEQVSAVKQVIAECIQDKAVNVGKIPLFTIEEMFVRLMQFSVSDIHDLAYMCRANHPTKEGEKCDTRIEMSVDLKKFNVVETPGHTNKVMLDETIGIKFNYPNIDMAQEAEEGADDTDTIIQCIDMIFDGDEVHSAADYTKQDLVDFWKQLTLMQKKDVYDKFFNTIPHIQYKTEVTCKKCGTVHPLEFNSFLELFL